MKYTILIRLNGKSPEFHKGLTKDELIPILSTIIAKFDFQDLKISRQTR